jgi:hypothetical protein
MTTWHITPDPAMHERVQEIAKREMRSVANMARVLIAAAMFSRQLTEGKQARNNSLVATIRGEQP